MCSYHFVQVRDVTHRDSSYTFNASFYDDNTTTFVPMSVKLPDEAIDAARRRVSSTSVRIVSVGFRSNSLFPSSRTTDWVRRLFPIKIGIYHESTDESHMCRLFQRVLETPRIPLKR